MVPAPAEGVQINCISAKGISWPSDASRYAETKYDPETISPPKDWIGGKYRNATVKSTWKETGVTFNPANDEHFQVWMRTAGLPTFRKLYGRNDDTDLPEGVYELPIEYSALL